MSRKVIYARQSKTGRIYALDPDKDSTKVFLGRKDISVYNPEEAKTRIEARKKRLAELENQVMKPIDQEIIDDAKELADLESKIEAKEKQVLNESLKEEGILDTKDMTQEEIDRIAREKIIDEDPEIKNIEAMTTKQQVIDYVAEEFGKIWEVDSNKKLDVYKSDATILRIDRLFEGD